MTLATGKADTVQQFKVIGTRPIRPDGYEKVTGTAIYGGDVRLPGMVWGEVLRSPHAHARIRSIDTAAALKMRGVLAAITHSDLPPAESGEVPFYERVFLRPVWTSIRVLARDKALYQGHAVAAVAAIDRNTALEALKRIKVDYEPLAPVLNVDEAISPGAPVIMEDLVGDHLGKRVPNTNVAWHFRYAVGKAEKSFKKCSLVAEREVNLQMVHQGYIEPHNATAIWGPDGRITIWASTQGAFGLRTRLADILRVPESLIRVMPVEIGGGFGGKTGGGVYLEPLAAVLSRKTGHPVKMLMDRKSVFEGTGPAHGGKVRVKLGVDDRGLILSGVAEIRLEAGAIPGSWVDASANCVFAAYNIPNSRIDGYDILVNKPKTAPYRASGSPQAAFATEQVIDEICETKGWDKIDFRLRNASREGSRRADGPIVFGRIGLVECLKATKNSEHWKSRLTKKALNGHLRGRGIAVGYLWQMGGRSAVEMTVGSDGVVLMNEGSVDIGGTRASVAMQAAEVLGIPVDDVRPTIPDTDSIGFTGTTGGSRTAYATGLAAYRAAFGLIEAMKGRAAMLWNREVEDISFKDGTFSSNTNLQLALSFKELCARLESTGGPARVNESVNLPGLQPGRTFGSLAAGHNFAIGICDIEVDPETGKVDILRYTVIQDVGKAVHPSYVEGQMQGGTVQGIGWALNEEYFYTPDGAMANPSFLDYRMPIAPDVPKIDAVIVEVPNPLHPFGVRGCAEVSIVPPLAAVANALHDALGVRFNEQPMKPGRILEALANRGRPTRAARTTNLGRRH